MDIKDILGLVFLIGIGVLLYRSFIQQQEAAGQPTSFSFTDEVSWGPILLGLFTGAAIGIVVFWPTLFDTRLPFDEVMKIWNTGGQPFSTFITPWIIKTVICALIGGALGFIVPKVMKVTTAH